MDEQKYSILVVDDEKSNLIALTHILSPDYIVRSATNGKDAIKTAERLLPNVILLDIIMPEMDGFAVIAELTKSEKTKNIPVIFITGLSNHDDEEKGLALGAADYITKPFSSAIVKLRVRNQIKMLEQLRTIEHISLTDQLTNLPNRRSFDARLNEEWARARREQMPISILAIDIDKFKNYNDSYGHQQGDAALQSVAKTFGQVLKRPGDYAARWGGEEFFILLSNSNMQGALEIAEQIREAMQLMDIPYPDDCDKSAAKVTVSIGVNTKTHTDEITEDEFILRADQALYTAKENGRNRVCHFLQVK